MPKVLDNIRHRAKIIRRTQGGTYRSALKRAGAEYRAGKLSGVKKKRTTHKRKRVGVTYQPVKVEHCAPAGAQVMGAVSHTKKLLKEQLGWLLATRETARTQREKRALAPKIADLKRKLKALS